MVRRTAKRGANAGNEFWGCSTFPKCRAIVAIDSSGSGDAGGAAVVSRGREAAAANSAGDGDPPVRAPTASDAQERPDEGVAPSAVDDGKPRGRVFRALKKTYDTVENVRRSSLELGEPDAAGRFSPENQRARLRWLLRRDGGRCGLCGVKMPEKGAHIEHIVPKLLTRFDTDERGKARQGTRWTSRQHQMDNLQAAHPYCNKNKGNTPDISKWRHFEMPSVPVADTDDGETLYLPR